MKQNDLKTIFLKKGWNEDRHGHLKTKKNGRVLRLKFQAKSCRFEVEVKHEATQYSPASKSWVKIGGDYYSKIQDNGKTITVGNSQFAKP